VSVADEFAGAFKAVTKDLLAEKKKRERDARLAAKDAARRWREAPSVTLRAAVFEVMETAAAHASEGGRYEVPARNLYYAVRKLIQAHTDDELAYKYFDKILLDSQQEHGPIPGLYRDPRGELAEPHTGRVVRLGTREVAGYTLPDYLYGAILYVEKEGFGPILRESKLAERYDLAIASGKGQPVEAVRALFERAERGDYKLFVLHDADPDGYSIARTISEETRRMPGYSVDVTDLGLTVADAIRLGIPPEAFTRKKALPWWMPGRLTEIEREWFEGPLISSHWEKRQWECWRAELNAFTPSGLVAYIEEGPDRHGVTKITPPQDVLDEQAAQSHRDQVRERVEQLIDEWLDIDQVVDTLVTETAERATGGISPDWLAGVYEGDRAAYWRTAVGSRVTGHLDGLGEEIRSRTRELTGLGPPEEPGT
jgi:hypothetical protein